MIHKLINNVHTQEHGCLVTMATESKLTLNTSLPECNIS